MQLQLEIQYYPDLPAPNVRERVCLERVTIRTLNDTSADTSADSPLDSSAVGFPVIAGLNRNRKSGQFENIFISCYYLWTFSLDPLSQSDPSHLRLLLKLSL